MYKNHEKHKKARKMSSQLRLALEHYRSSHEVANLALEYQKVEESYRGYKLADHRGFFQILQDIGHGFSTFRLMPVKKKRSYLRGDLPSDSEALYSDWSSVGDDLAYSWSKYIVERHDRRRA